MAQLHSRKRTTGRPWMRLRAAVLDAQPLCVRCLAAGRTVAAREVDHVLPVHRGGTDAPARRGKVGHRADGVPLARLGGGGEVRRGQGRQPPEYLFV